MNCPKSIALFVMWARGAIPYGIAALQVLGHKWAIDLCQLCIDNLFATLKTSSNFVSQMNTISIAISDVLILKLQKVAAEMNVSIEELILMSIESSIAQRENPAANTDRDIFNKNAEISSEVIDKFYTLATEWQSEVAGMSSTAQMSQHPAYQEIINMGSKVVPLLLSELQKNPLYWLAALNAITGENPIKPEQRGRVKQMASAWIEWGRDRGYVIEENV
ncbi:MULTISPECIES: hypothetical protein [unclassified Microcoleus]|uniref:hypothetical protein n=1 Tax=unclassified Microcoleus TaxID=2642155 RepID=UPI002FCE8542